MLRNIISFFIIILVFSCGGKPTDDTLASTTPENGTTIPILKTEKLRKSRLTFDLTEVIRSGDQLDMVVMVTNRSDDAMLFYDKDEFSLTDNNGYIYKVAAAKIGKVKQFGSGMSIARIPTDGKLKSIISFEGIREDASSGTLFFKGEANRKKNTDFKVKFSKVKLKE